MMEQQASNNSNSLYNGNWNMSDWSGIAGPVSTFPSQQQQQQQNNASLSPSDYFTHDQVSVLNSSGGVGTGGNGTSWKLLQDFQPAGNNMSNAFLLLDDAKLQLLDLDHQLAPVVSVNESTLVIPVEQIKEEEVDPWTEHVNYATHHNHTYAAPVSGRRARSREVSEELDK